KSPVYLSVCCVSFLECHLQSHVVVRDPVIRSHIDAVRWPKWHDRHARPSQSHSRPFPARSEYFLPETDHLLPKEYACCAPLCQSLYLALKNLQTQKNHILFCMICMWFFTVFESRASFRFNSSAHIRIRNEAARHQFQLVLPVYSQYPLHR